MTLFIRRNSDIVLTFIFLALVLTLAAFDVAGQSSTNISRKCPGASPSPARAVVDVEKDGDIAITPCNGRAVNFTSATTFAIGNGTAAAPSFTFTSDPDTGMFRSGANALGFSTGGTERGTLSSAGLFTTTGGISTTTGVFSGVVTGANGTAGAPSFSFTNSPTTGFFRSAADSIGVSTAGTERWLFNSSGSLNPFVTRTYDIGGSTLIRDLGLGRTLVATQGTLAASTPFVNHTATWNNAGVTFSNFTSNVTDTASGANSLLFDLQVDGVSKAKIDKDGDLTVNSCAGCGGLTMTATDANFLPKSDGTNLVTSRIFDNGTNILINSVVGYTEIGDTGGAANSTKFKVSNEEFTFSSFANFATLYLTGIKSVRYNRTMTAAGTTGNQSIHTPAGTVNFAAGTASLTVTSNNVDANSIILLTARTNDATCAVKSVVAAAGSFVINMTANCTAETSVGFLVTN